MDIAAIRYANLQLLIEQAGGYNKGGIAAIARKLGKSQAQLSQVAGAKPIKNVGSRLAREIEELLALPVGWLDTLQAAAPPLTVREPATVSYLPSQPTGPALENMALAVETTRYWIDFHGLAGSVEDHIPLLAIAHELVLEVRSAGAPGTVLDLSKKLAARLREESGHVDERGSGAGTGGKNGRVRGDAGDRGPR